MNAGRCSFHFWDVRSSKWHFRCDHTWSLFCSCDESLPFTDHTWRGASYGIKPDSSGCNNPRLSPSSMRIMLCCHGCNKCSWAVSIALLHCSLSTQLRILRVSECSVITTGDHVFHISNICIIKIWGLSHMICCHFPSAQFVWSPSTAPGNVLGCSCSTRLRTKMSLSSFIFLTKLVFLYKISLHLT